MGAVVRYEFVIVVRQDVGVSHVEKLGEECEKLIAESGGQVKHKEYCGLLPLAYTMGTSKRAHYLLIDSEGSAGHLRAANEKMRLSSDVLRTLDVRVKCFGERPSVLSASRGQWVGGKPDFTTGVGKKTESRVEAVGR